MDPVEWNQVSAFTGPEASPGFLLWKVSTQWRRKIETALETLDLTHPQFVLLAGVSWLTRNGNRVTQVELAKHCGTDITMTSQVLRLLEKKGLLNRERQGNDERSKFPRVTELGGELIEKAIPLVESIDRQFFGTLGEELQACVSILQHLGKK